MPSFILYTIHAKKSSPNLKQPSTSLAAKRKQQKNAEQAACDHLTNANRQYQEGISIRNAVDKDQKNGDKKGVEKNIRNGSKKGAERTARKRTQSAAYERRSQSHETAENNIKRMTAAKK